MKAKDWIGYLTGFLLFVVLLPLGMLRLSGEVRPGFLPLLCFACLAVLGLGLSIWSIVHMRKIGKGNPMDAFNHAIAPRTSELMTDGPYRLCRNPMLLGVLLYYLGLLICLRSWGAAAVFVGFFLLMMLQVRREEQRLERDFGDAYREYRARTRKLIPFVW